MMLKLIVKNTGKKILWLLAGLIVGVGISTTFADSRVPASYEFRVLAVSEEDASEKASEMLRAGALSAAVDTARLVAASVPKCAERGADFACETHLVYRD